MSGEFKQACLSVERSAKAPMAKPERLTELGRLARTLDALPAGGIGRPPPDIQQVAEDIRNAVARGSTLTRRQVRQGTWCLWNENTRLADDTRLRAELFDQVALADRPGPFRSLALNFLEAFRPDEAGIVTASTLLESLATKWPGNWSRLHRDFRIFDIEEGPLALARAVASQDRSPEQILRDYDVSLMKANYTRVTTGALLEHLASGGEPNHERRIEKVQRYALGANGKPAFGDMVRQIAEAILLPFNGIKPAKALLDRVLNLLTKALGDPRLEGARWRQVPDALTSLVKGWLAEQSLRQFLDVVGDTTDRPDQWRYRRAFWEGLHDLGLISEAWVAFGSRGERRVRERFGRDVRFGTVEKLTSQDKTVDPGHAVLFLRIGDSLVTDWSHMGRCNIWSDAEAPDAPALYKDRYASNSVLIPGTGHTIEADRMAITHSSPEYYSWQRMAAERLHELTGRRIRESDYRI
jgi:hypothetical protein